MNRGAWHASPWGHEKLDMTERLILSHLCYHLIRKTNKAYVKYLTCSICTYQAPSMC